MRFLNSKVTDIPTLLLYCIRAFHLVRAVYAARAYCTQQDLPLFASTLSFLAKLSRASTRNKKRLHQRATLSSDLLFFAYQSNGKYLQLAEADKWLTHVH